jgi:hypothetical protein
VNGVGRLAGAISAVTCLAVAAFALAGVRENGFTVGGGATEGGAVACKRGQVPTEGGFTLEQDPLLAVHSTYPAGKRWKVEAYNLEGAEGTGSAIALCKSSKGLFVRSKTAEHQGDSREDQVVARCPKGSSALGGGGRGPGQNQRMRGSFPEGDGRSWGARFDNVSDGDRMEAFVVCDKHANVSIVQTSDAPKAKRGSREASVDAECDANTDLVGGGFYSPSNATYYRESRPAGNAWRVKAIAGTSVSVSSFAVCRK